MSLEIVLMLLIVTIAMVLFSLEKLPTDVIAMGLVLALTLTGLLPPEKAFAGFGSDTVVMIFGLLILTRALVRTGVADSLSKLILNLIRGAARARAAGTFHHCRHAERPDEQYRFHGALHPHHRRIGAPAAFAQLQITNAPRFRRHFSEFNYLGEYLD